MSNLILINLPRDMGDCVLASPALLAVQRYAEKNGHAVACLGAASSHAWVEAVTDKKFNRIAPEDAQNPLMILDFNLHPHALPNHLKDATVFAPEKLRHVAEDEKDFGATAMIGKKHIFHLNEDCVRNAGMIGIDEKLPLPAMAAGENVFGLDKTRYALLIPVCAPQRPQKKWPAEKFALLARRFWVAGIVPVLMGGPSADEKETCAAIAKMAGHGVIDLGGKTTVKDVASLAAGAVAVVGNDTGPVHIAAAAGANTYSFFGYYNDADSWRPLSPNAHVLAYGRRPADLTVDAVWDSVSENLALMPQNPVNACRNGWRKIKMVAVP